MHSIVTHLVYEFRWYKQALRHNVSTDSMWLVTDGVAPQRSYMQTAAPPEAPVLDWGLTDPGVLLGAPAGLMASCNAVHGQGALQPQSLQVEIWV